MHWFLHGLQEDDSTSLDAVPSGRRAEYAAATRRSLVDTARRLLTERGYAATSLDDVAAAAGVTKGALYHHFANKKELFEAVVAAVQDDLLTVIGAGAVENRDPWEGLMAAIDRYLDACLEPDVQTILLLEAPTVLGWDRWREMEERYGLGLTRAALEVAMEAGLIERRPVTPLSHLVLGALTEGAMYIARAEDRATARAEVGEAVRALMEGLRA